MRIAVNTRFLLKDRLEGFGRFTYETLRRLVAAHPEHTFIFFFDRPYDASFVFADNVLPVVLNPPARHPFLFVLWFEMAVYRALKRYKADVFLSTDNFCSLRTAVPTCLVVHDLAYKYFDDNERFIHKLYYRFFMPRFVAKAQRLVTVSEFVRQDLRHHFPFLEHKAIDVAHNGCSSGFVPLPEADKEAVRAAYTEGVPYFLFVGAVHPRKNVHRLIAAFDAFKTATNSPFKLVICGRFAWQTGAVRAAYEATTHQKDIIFTGFLPDLALRQLTAAAHAVTYVSLFEGFGIPILEAFEAEVPVLTAQTSAMPEVAAEAAMCVDPYSIGAIAAALTTLATDPSVCADLVAKGRRRRADFSWDKTAQVLYQALENTLSPTHSPK